MPQLIKILLLCIQLFTHFCYCKNSKSSINIDVPSSFFNPDQSTEFTNRTTEDEIYSCYTMQHISAFTEAAIKCQHALRYGNGKQVLSYKMPNLIAENINDDTDDTTYQGVSITFNDTIANVVKNNDAQMPIINRFTATKTTYKANLQYALEKKSIFESLKTKRLDDDPTKFYQQSYDTTTKIEHALQSEVTSIVPNTIMLIQRSVKDVPQTAFLIQPLLAIYKDVHDAKPDDKHYLEPLAFTALYGDSPQSFMNKVEQFLMTESLIERITTINPRLDIDNKHESKHYELKSVKYDTFSLDAATFDDYQISYRDESTNALAHITIKELHPDQLDMHSFNKRTHKALLKSLPELRTKLHNYVDIDHLIAHLNRNRNNAIYMTHITLNEEQTITYDQPLFHTNDDVFIMKLAKKKDLILFYVQNHNAQTCDMHKDKCYHFPIEELASDEECLASQRLGFSPIHDFSRGPRIDICPITAQKALDEDTTFIQALIYPIRAVFEDKTNTLIFILMTIISFLPPNTVSDEWSTTRFIIYLAVLATTLLRFLSIHDIFNYTYYFTLIQAANACYSLGKNPTKNLYQFITPFATLFAILISNLDIHDNEPPVARALIICVLHALSGITHYSTGQPKRTDIIAFSIIRLIILGHEILKHSFPTSKLLTFTECFNTAYLAEYQTSYSLFNFTDKLFTNLEYQAPRFGYLIMTQIDTLMSLNYIIVPLVTLLFYMILVSLNQLRYCYTTIDYATIPQALSESISPILNIADGTLKFISRSESTISKNQKIQIQTMHDFYHHQLLTICITPFLDVAFINIAISLQIALTETNRVQAYSIMNSQFFTIKDKLKLTQSAQLEYFEKLANFTDVRTILDQAKNIATLHVGDSKVTAYRTVDHYWTTVAHAFHKYRPNDPITMNGVNIPSIQFTDAISSQKLNKDSVIVFKYEDDPEFETRPEPIQRGTLQQGDTLLILGQDKNGAPKHTMTNNYKLDSTKNVINYDARTINGDSGTPVFAFGNDTPLRYIANHAYAITDYQNRTLATGAILIGDLQRTPYSKQLAVKNEPFPSESPEQIKEKFESSVISILQTQLQLYKTKLNLATPDQEAQPQSDKNDINIWKNPKFTNRNPNRSNNKFAPKRNTDKPTITDTAQETTADPIANTATLSDAQQKTQDKNLDNATDKQQAI